MRFEHSQLNQLDEAIRAAFTTDDLELLLSVRLNARFDDIVSPVKATSFRIRKVVEHFNGAYEIERLVAAVHAARPRVPDFTVLAEVAGLIRLPETHALQALLRPSRGGTVGQDPDEFRRKLALRENTLCRIVVAGRRCGTGMLVADDLVLTNSHVVAGCFTATAPALADVICQFDYRIAKSGEIASPATPIRATEIVASSPHAAADMALEPANESPNFLDYAILRVERRIS